MRFTFDNIHINLPTYLIFCREEKNNKTHDATKRRNENKNSVGFLIFNFHK